MKEEVLTIQITEKEAEVILNSIHGWTLQEGQGLEYGVKDEKALFNRMLKLFPKLKDKYRWD